MVFVGREEHARAGTFSIGISDMVSRQRIAKCSEVWTQSVQSTARAAHGKKKMRALERKN